MVTMTKSEIALAALLISAGIAIFFMINWMDSWTMHGYRPGYNQMIYGPDYWMGPNYGYGPGYSIYTNYVPRYWMGPWMIYKYEPDNNINQTYPQMHIQSYSISIADELNKLATLKKEGLITEDEYSKLKNQLI
jgi:hypothetical protein